MHEMTESLSIDHLGEKIAIYQDESSLCARYKQQRHTVRLQLFKFGC